MNIRDGIGLSSTFVGLARADVRLACGAFGNISDADLEATFGALSALVAPDGAVVWTRGAHLGDDELSGCAPSRQRRSRAYGLDDTAGERGR